MNIWLFMVCFGGLFLFMLALHYIDAKKGWQLSAWMNGECANPFEARIKKKTSSDVQERLAVLEKIVTEPAYELNKKINQL